MNDYEILCQKFDNFKSFVKKTCTNSDAYSKFSLLSNEQWLLLCNMQVVPLYQAGTLEQGVKDMVMFLGLKDDDTENINKLKRYLECFCEYILESDSLKQMIKEEEKNEESGDPYLDQLSKINL